MVGKVGVDEAKRQMRVEMRLVRDRIAHSGTREARSRRIWARIVSSGHLGADRLESGTQRAQKGPPRVMLYEALAGEPDTAPWFEWCRAHELEVFTPEVDGPELRVQPGDVDPATLDVVVVPGLAFTADGRRLGQGGGHFDRFLPRLRVDCLTIGVCYAEQLLADLPTAAHDARVDRVITD